MSYLEFRHMAGQVHLRGPEMHNIFLMAEVNLGRQLAQPEYRQVRAELRLPGPGTRFYQSQVMMLMGDGEAHRIQGKDVYLADLALNLLYEQDSAAGILCWLADQALVHG